MTTTIRDEHLTAVFSNAGHVLTHMAMILYATAVLYLPGIFDLPYGEMLSLSSVGLVLYGVAALPAGWFGDRWSQVGMMVVFFMGVGCAAIIIGTASTATHLFAGLSLIGLFAAIYHPVGIAWLVAATTRQGRTLGINGLFGGIGGACAAPFVGLMVDNYSWRAAFVGPGLVSIFIGLALWVAWRRGIVEDITADRTVVQAPSPHAMKRAFFVLTLTMVCAGFVYAGLTNTMPKLFEQGLSHYIAGDYTTLGLIVGAVSAAASVSSVIGGWLADRYSPKVIYIGCWSLMIAPLLYIPDSRGISLVALTTSALFMNTGFAAAENMLVARFTPFAWRSLAYGSKFVLALGIGGLTVHLAGDLFGATGSFATLYLLLGAAAAIGAVCALLLPGAHGKTESGNVISANASIQK